MSRSITQWVRSLRQFIKPNRMWKGPYAVLTVIKGPSKLEGRAVNLLYPKFVVGRDSGNTDLCLYPHADTTISRVHCIFECQPDGLWTVIDNRSKNATELNGRRLEPLLPHALADNDEIQLGVLTRYGAVLRFNFLDNSGT